jgi:hypothetical protein
MVCRTKGIWREEVARTEESENMTVRLYLAGMCLGTIADLSSSGLHRHCLVFHSVSFYSRLDACIFKNRLSDAKPRTSRCGLLQIFQRILRRIERETK